MGMFDSVHTGHRCGQTKALGTAGRDLVPGDPVRLIPAPMSPEDLDLWAAGHPRALDVADFQLRMVVGWLTVRGGQVGAWLDDPDPALPAFDALGRPVDARAAARPAPVIPDQPQETAETQLLALLTGQRTLYDLDPVRDAQAWADRCADLEQMARQRYELALGLPGDCPVCARLRRPRLVSG